MWFKYFSTPHFVLHFANFTHKAKTFKAIQKTAESYYNGTLSKPLNSSEYHDHTESCLLPVICSCLFSLVSSCLYRFL